VSRGARVANWNGRPRETNVEADDLTNQVFDTWIWRNVLTFLEAAEISHDQFVDEVTESFSKRKHETVPSQASGPLQKFAKSKW